MLKGLLACHRQHHDNNLVNPEIYFDGNAGVFGPYGRIEATLQLLEGFPKQSLTSDGCRELLGKLREYAP